jgi:DNA-binding response OmpR family regulator
MSGTRSEVLIVEDNPGDAFMIEEMLNELKLELKVSVVKDGQEALDILSDGQDNVPDLVILDLNLPRVDGFGVLKYMKARQKLSSIPVVVMTGSLRTEDEKMSRELGAADYCLKPATVDEMDTTINCLKRNLAIQPTKGREFISDTTLGMGLNLIHTQVRRPADPIDLWTGITIDFHNHSPWDSWN